MSQKITCPHCKKEFPMEQGLESHFNDLKQSVINEKKKIKIHFQLQTSIM